MEIDAQIQLLIDNAPQDGETPQLLVMSIAPVLRAIAQKLRYSEYYIQQSLSGNWVLTTLSHKTNPQIEKQVIYAFPRLQDVSLFSPAGLNPQMVAHPIPVTHILFQLLALEPVDSIVFWETPSPTSNAIEISRQELQSLIQQQIRQVPPHIA
jgi:hypothetical protein